MMRLFLATVSRPTLGSTQPATQEVTGDPFPGVKQLGREDDHSSPTRAEVKNGWSYISTHPICLHGVVLNSAMNALSWRDTKLSTETSLPY
jgi:hypothetical protein